MTATAAASSYSSRPLDVDDASLAAYSALLSTTFGPMPLPYVRWLYAQNPVGNAVGVNAFDGSELVAHYVTVPVDATIDGRAAKGLLSLNTATHPAHQGKGLFTRLANETYAYAADHGFEFVVGVANANSTPGFTRKLGFQLVSPLDVLVGAGRCQAGTAPVAFAISWADPALRWRLSRPGATYFGTPRDGVVDVHADAQKAGVLAYMTSVPASVAASLPHALPAAPRLKPLRMWIGIDPHLVKSGVLAPLPDKLKPSPLNLIYRDLTGKARTLDRAALRFTLLDFDAY